MLVLELISVIRFKIMKSSVILFFLILLTRSFSQVLDMPGGILSEIWYLITNGTVEHFLGCKTLENFSETDIQYQLYNRENRYPVILTSEEKCELDPSKDTKIIFNGWLGSAKDQFIVDMVHAYLDRYDCNVIAVEYFNLTFTEYSQAYCNVISASQMIINFLCELYEEKYLDFSQVHIVGFSLGAHLSGLIGQGVQKQCNQKVDRITGLDPAGPIYQNQADSARLDKSDATFVDVIHTNMGMFGYYGSNGHVDFFPNCGSVQPSCVSIDKFPNVINVILEFIRCSHTRSVQLFTESISTVGPRFNSTSCTLCPNSKGIGKCVIGDVLLFKPEKVVMGEDCPRNPKANKFILKTNSKPPYAQG